MFRQSAANVNSRRQRIIHFVLLGPCFVCFGKHFFFCPKFDGLKAANDTQMARHIRPQLALDLHRAGRPQKSNVPKCQSDSHQMSYGASLLIISWEMKQECK